MKLRSNMNGRRVWKYLTIVTIYLEFTGINAEKFWDVWGSYGPCSRTCGGGVQSRQRNCLYQRSRSGRKQRCDDNAQQEVEYQSCNTQSCGEGSMDFRAIQCQDFDNIPFLGREYQWKPYYDGEERCSLVCLAVNTSVYHEWSDKVIDGTRCNKLSDDQCVDGVCQKAGCDNVLGSPAQRDVCGVCQGQGRSCKLIQGAFTIPQLYSGYNEIITLQKGSTSILIKEMEFSPNFLVLKSNEETFVLNGQQRDDKQVLIDIGGTTLFYSLEGSGRNLVKKLRGQGPTKYSIQIYMMAKEEVNPGVSYEFYIPRTGREALYIPTESLGSRVQTLGQRQAELRSGDIGESSFFWNYGGWTPCSAICGNGFRRRLVLCMNRLTGKRAEPENCEASERPADSEQCKGDDCNSTPLDSTVEWELGDWGPCSSSCDIGDQLQGVTCISTDPQGRSVTVDDQKCIQLYGRKPEYRRSCNENIPCPHWTPMEEWSSCNKDCGMGEQNREVVCVSIDNRRLAESACDSSKKPASTRPCMVRQCDSSPEDPRVTCSNSPFGCCQDGRTSAQGLNFEGCPQECTTSRYGCCPDQKTPARGPNGENCPPECLQSRYGCCQDQKTPARGPNEEGCPSDCSRTQYGCCLDQKTPARGPNREGCPSDCSRTRFGCCSDNRTPSRGPNGEGCTVHCSRYRYGCCPDNATIARGPNGEGCPTSCSDSTYGCCPDGVTERSGLNNEGCSLECSRYRFGCCPDNLTPARGPNGEGCPNVCSTSRYGCCEDGTTEARGPNREGCQPDCSRRRYGCCPDNVTPARGPNGEGCLNECAVSLYGCCPDKKTSARGPNREGCPADCNRYRYGCCADNVTPARGVNGEGCPSNCTMSQYGCCPDRLTEAKGFNFEGCPNQCLRSRYGCCPDGRTEARGPNNEGCFYVECSRYQFGCCSDNVTIARGPDGEGCLSNCTLSVFGCCADQVTEAQGYNMEGCPNECLRSVYGCCPDGLTEARGPNAEGCSLSCEDMQFGCCPDNQTPARGPNGQGCYVDCTRYQYGCCSDEVTPARGPRGEGCPNNCTLSQYGCCPDQVTEAKGYDNEGCSRDCRTSRYGCCPDVRTEARGPNGEGCEMDCARLRFGCCPDTNTPARGPDGEGCPSDCTRSQYGCCYDGTTSASGPDGMGCPPDCLRYRYGCCSDNVTIARGPNGEGCPSNCTFSQYGCCLDEVTSARGFNFEGCPPQCLNTRFGCCADNTTKARGPNGEGCLFDCSRTQFGCCLDQKTPARGPNREGCPSDCSRTRFGCCSDNRTPARGPNGEGCTVHCSRYRFGCCPDNVTIARGPDSEGCPTSCSDSTYGCCPDGRTAMRNPNGEGCVNECSRTRYGCCSDNQTPARGPNQEGCLSKCKNSIYGCCSDGVTQARGPNGEGCVFDCGRRTYGCCADNRTPARGPNGEGCPRVCELSRFGCCPYSNISATGPNYSGCPYTCFTSIYGCCSDNYTAAKGPNQEGCQKSCQFSRFGCCLNSNISATGPNYSGCPYTCFTSLYGCCPDNYTAARGPNQEGCPSLCDQYPYGCCQDGETPANGPRQEGCPSGDVQLDSCGLEPERGPCSNYSVLYFYNSTSKRCQRFWYGGCDGNDNRFNTEDECKEKCSGSKIENTDRNTVTARQTCENSYYGCCPDGVTFARGPSYEGCTQSEDRPVCQQPSDSGRDCAEAKLVIRWYYKTDIQRCDRFWYRGCGGNNNNFKSDEECQQTCTGGGRGRPDMIRNLNVHHATSDEIMVTWEPPQNNDVESYKVAYLGTKYYRDTVKQDPMKEIVLTSDSRSYTMNNLMDGADYMINVYPQFNGRGIGPKSSIMGKTKTLLLCDDSRYGCCPDGITAAAGLNYAGCADEDPCKKSTWGCCEDGISEATGPNFEGCDLDGRPSGDFCNETVYGCCPDGETPAQGPNYDGCPREPEVTPVGVCQMKEDRGPCSDYEVKWFYNKTSLRCDRFWYGGCAGNDNRFDDEEACSRRCKQTTPDTGSKPVCEQPKVTGPCRAYFKKYYFNGRECEQFIYGGCQGNENSFDTIEQCEATCEIDIDNTRGQETCQQPMDTGPCRGNIPRWYFDRQSNQCLEFLYGGCQGNTNNFETREECQRSCASGTGQPDRQDQDVCKLNSDPGPCRALVPRWFYDYNDGVCKEFSYGGCDGNQNNYETRQECESTCSREHVCKPFITGQIQCLAYQRRYKYDATSGDCMQFIYGGCGGNSNNFGSVEACRRKCAPERLSPTVTTESPIEGSGDGGEGYCHLKVEQGSCKASIPAWYYDHLTGMCNQFQYGGCGGNENRFTSREVCESSCSRENVCNYEKEEGNCLAYFQRYFYNKNTKSCEGFIYGGCGGNANNFDSLDSCNSKCIQTDCSNQDFKCRSGQCIDVRLRCDGVPDCTDGSDEDRALCGASTSCPEGYFRCADSSCVAGRRCDGRQDCADNSDEYQCVVQNPPSEVDVTPSRDDNYQVLLRWRAPASTGLNPVLDYKILYTNRGPNADESQWYTQQAEGNQEYMYVSGLQPDSTYYFKIQARNAGGYGPFSRAVVYIAPSRATDAPRGKDPDCMLPLDRGSCSNMTIMYYYDPSISDCRPFRWYGCTGNANRFSSGQECRSRCWDRYNVIPTRGPVYPTERPPVTSRPTYPTERPPVTTRRPIYPTEAPRVTTTREYTINVDLCDEKDERGPCRNYTVKWFYDKDQQKCRRFWYGGCDGNANRFNDEQECQDMCINRVRPNPGTPATTKAPDDKDNEIDDKTCGSRFGCCPDGITPARDFYLSNCNDETGPDTEVIQGDYTSLIKEPDTDVMIQCNRYQTGYGSISWYKDGFQLTQTSRVFIQSDGSLMIRMATVDDSGMYACRVASVGSSPEIERFRLQVEARGEKVPITIFPTPAKIVVQPGMNAFLHCQAYGNPRPRVTWSKDGYDVSRDPRFSVFPNGTLIIQRTLEQDMGSYLCVANNGVSNPAQRIVMLQLRESLRASIEQVEERKREGETLYLTCSGFGYPTPSITWEKNGLPLTSDQRIKIQGGSLRVINLALEDTGTYTCIVMNDEEKVEDTVAIQVTPFDLGPSTCVDTASKFKCTLIVAARLCGHTRYSRPCCMSCEKEKARILQQSSPSLG